MSPKAYGIVLKMGPIAVCDPLSQVYLQRARRYSNPAIVESFFSTMGTAEGTGKTLRHISCCSCQPETLPSNIITKTLESRPPWQKVHMALSPMAKGVSRNNADVFTIPSAGFNGELSQETLSVGDFRPGDLDTGCSDFVWKIFRPTTLGERGVTYGLHNGGGKRRMIHIFFHVYI